MASKSVCDGPFYWHITRHAFGLKPELAVYAFFSNRHRLVVLTCTLRGGRYRWRVQYDVAVLQAAAEAVAHGTCLSAEARGMVKAYVGGEITVQNTKQCDVKPQVVVTGEAGSAKATE